MDYIGIIHQFIDPIVADKENVTIEEIESRYKNERCFVIRCNKDDMGRLIGKRGITANAIREVVSIAAKNNGERIHIKIDSLDSENNEEQVEEIVSEEIVSE